MKKRFEWKLKPLFLIHYDAYGFILSSYLHSPQLLASFLIQQ